MPVEQPPEFIRLLAHDLRWSLLKALTVSDYRVHELVEWVDQPMNLVSYHLKKMRDDALVTMRRSEADGRDVYYSLDLNRLRDLYRTAGRRLHPTLDADAEQKTISQTARVLFLCTHNSARSQMAEGLMRHLSVGQIDVSSAGSHPTQVHPNAIKTMDTLGIDIRKQRPKSLNTFENQAFDYVITVCDKAREVCPLFPGQAQQIHWGFPDPVAIDDEVEQAGAFEEIAQRLKSRIESFLVMLSVN
jgi:ArsR family transcriptional regulator, arsenate/arsenite/antimonite-responsive transcriptional repressor / arsenate reductase (thioredoxin)